ncbi:hypothetical protein DICPUDRAFT_149222 [Dictyostelium purpureum]|uniref:Homeobox domain-containing protein n=1 Tax=Dictyostelium purpureum TaxID=5786 RepID=F0ZD46_DICPU|nr:uncharacterized protein DICPUDRAFT_149222 [Dictyostelium purpureum]EGC38115.1 hypothetical protein DICPUDRAFT_149222 [Dictyostelium purpureum]|eukprot:XP_003285329.1 hypothetical protein DICPUDRAFT_149222 [Dictyostelium purpureum]
MINYCSNNNNSNNSSNINICNSITNNQTANQHDYIATTTSLIGSQTKEELDLNENNNNQSSNNNNNIRNNSNTPTFISNEFSNPSSSIIYPIPSLILNNFINNNINDTNNNQNCNKNNISIENQLPVFDGNITPIYTPSTTPNLPSDLKTETQIFISPPQTFLQYQPLQLIPTQQQFSFLQLPQQFLSPLFPQNQPPMYSFQNNYHASPIQITSLPYSPPNSQANISLAYDSDKTALKDKNNDNNDNINLDSSKNIIDNNNNNNIINNNNNNDTNINNNNKKKDKDNSKRKRDRDCDNSENNLESLNELSTTKNTSRRGNRNNTNNNSIINGNNILNINYLDIIREKQELIKIKIEKLTNQYQDIDRSRKEFLKEFFENPIMCGKSKEQVRDDSETNNDSDTDSNNNNNSNKGCGDGIIIGFKDFSKLNFKSLDYSLDNYIQQERIDIRSPIIKKSVDNLKKIFIKEIKTIELLRSDHLQLIQSIQSIQSIIRPNLFNDQDKIVQKNHLFGFFALLISHQKCLAFDFLYQLRPQNMDHTIPSTVSTLDLNSSTSSSPDQQPNDESLGSVNYLSTLKKNRRTLNENYKKFITNYFKNNSDHPYPTEEEKIIISALVDLSKYQRNNWFSNKRSREKNNRITNLKKQKEN